MTRFPEIIAHRGASREALENTMPAFALALAQGADGIELDVHATRDGVVVVHHDPFVRHTGRREAPAVPIASLSATDATAWPLANGETMPTLDAVLALVGQRATVYVEVKAHGMEDHLAACLGRHPDCRVAVHSFDHRIPVALRERRPDLAIGVLSTSYPMDLAGFIGPAQPADFWQEANLVDGPLVHRSHALGARVVAWTVNDPAHARALVAMGVDALCTDRPGALRAALIG